MYKAIEQYRYCSYDSNQPAEATDDPQRVPTRAVDPHSFFAVLYLAIFHNADPDQALQNCSLLRTQEISVAFSY